MTLLSLENLTVQRGGRSVMIDISFDIQPGECVGLIGPNGAGKTSLMRAALGLIPHKGRSSLSTLGPDDRAKLASWMPQSREIAWPISVETIVALGRLPHLPRGKKLSAQDRSAVEAALKNMRLTQMRNRIATQLSGGEQARVLIARALAQDTPLLIADEPIAGLDPAGQIATMQVFSTLATQGHAVLVSSHDLGLAARHCTRLILLHDGEIYADGLPQEVLTAQNMRHVFGVSAHLQNTPEGIVFQPLDVISKTVSTERDLQKL